MDAAIGALLLLGAFFGGGIPQHLEKKSDETCLAFNIYKESRSESVRGQEAVAYITIGRSGDNLPDYGGKSICDVISHKTIRPTDGKSVYEFSWFEAFIKNPENAKLWKAGYFKSPSDKQAWKLAFQSARAVLKGKLPIPLELLGLRYFLNELASGGGGICFFRGLVFGVNIGRHDFYRRPHTLADALTTSRAQERCLQNMPPPQNKIVVAKKQKKKKTMIAATKSKHKQVAAKKGKGKQAALKKKSKNKKYASNTKKKKTRKT